MVRAIDGERLKGVIQYWINTYSELVDLDTCKIVQSAIDVMPTLTPLNEWVSVEERLPEKRGEYIVCACDGGEPIDERIWGDTVVVCADYYDGAFTWYEGNTEYDISDIVTHWMPLPAPLDKDSNVLAKTPNEPLTCDGCYWQTHGSFGQCFGCFREKTDNYRRLPEKEEEA